MAINEGIYFEVLHCILMYMVIIRCHYHHVCVFLNARCFMYVHIKMHRDMYEYLTVQ